MSESREEGSAIGISLITFLLGVAVGATVAILYAPASGTETRAQIADKAGQLKDKATELKSQVAEKAAGLKERAVELKDRASTLIRRGEDKAGAVEPAIAEA